MFSYLVSTSDKKKGGGNKRISVLGFDFREKRGGRSKGMSVMVLIFEERPRGRPKFSVYETLIITKYNIVF
jgi:hypothetical protein